MKKLLTFISLLVPLILQGAVPTKEIGTYPPSNSTPAFILGLDKAGSGASLHMTDANLIFKHNGNTIYVDPDTGDDDTGIIGRFDRPFKTLTNAFAIVTNQCTIYCAASSRMVYTNGTANPALQMYNPQFLMHDVTNVVVLGNGATLLRGSTNEMDFICFSNTFGVTMSGFVIDNNGMTLANDYSVVNYACVALHGDNPYFTFTGNTMKGFKRQGVCDWGRPIGKLSYGTRIYNNNFYGMGTTNAAGLADDGCCVGLGVPNWQVFNNFASNCLRFVEMEGASFASGATMYDGTIIKDNYCTNIWERAIVVINDNPVYKNTTRNLNIIGNIIYWSGHGPTAVGQPVDGIAVDGGTGIFITGNKIINSVGGITVYDNGGDYDTVAPVIADNWIENSTGNGILLADANHNTHIIGALVSGNRIINQTTYAGIVVAGSIGSQIINNTLISCRNQLGAIKLQFINDTTDVGTNTLVKGNYITDTNATPGNDYSIYVYGNFRDTRIEGNIIDKNAYKVGEWTNSGSGRVFFAGIETNTWQTFNYPLLLHTNINFTNGNVQLTAVTNNIAADGSLYLDKNGNTWLRSNAIWLKLNANGATPAPFTNVLGATFEIYSNNYIANFTNWIINISNSSAQSIFQYDIDNIKLNHVTNGPGVVFVDIVIANKTDTYLYFPTNWHIGAGAELFTAVGNTWRALIRTNINQGENYGNHSSLIIYDRGSGGGAAEQNAVEVNFFTSSRTFVQDYTDRVLGTPYRNGPFPAYITATILFTNNADNIFIYLNIDQDNDGTIDYSPFVSMMLNAARDPTTVLGDRLTLGAFLKPNATFYYTNTVAKTPKVGAYIIPGSCSLTPY